MAEKQWGKNPVVGVVAVAIILVALIFVVRAMVPKKYYYTADLQCESCQHIFQAQLYAGQKLPIKCEECGKMAAHRAVKCLDCGNIFIRKPIELPEGKPGEPPMPPMGPEMMPTCPKCASYNIGSLSTQPVPKKTE